MSDAVNLYAGGLIDGTGGPVRENALVRISTRRVHQVSCGIPIGQTHDVTWDFAQSTLLPGLIDSHVHLFMSGTANLAARENQLQAGYDVAVQGIAARLQRQLDHGVIAVRDGGDRWGHVQRFKGSKAQRLALPIRIFTAGKAWRRPGRRPSCPNR